MGTEKKQRRQYADGSEAQRPEFVEPAEAGDGFVPFSELPLSDGFLFGEVMQDEETCRTVLEIILKRPVGRVVYVNKEQQMEAATQYHKYKGIRLDVYFQDEAGTCYSVEMQTRNRYHLPKRSRHYQGMMDVQMLPAGELDYGKMPDSIIIFICTFDLFGEGRLCYTFENTCVELPDLKLADGAVKLFLNTEGTADSEEDSVLAELLRYVVDPGAPVESPAVKKVKRRVEEVKRNQETEARYMTSLRYVREVYEDGRIAGIEAGRQEGRSEGELLGETRGIARGKAKGKADDILELLDELGEVPEELRMLIYDETDLKRLTGWVKLAARSGSVEEFTEKM